MFTPYSTIAPLTNVVVNSPLVKPTWIPNELDQERILSYQLYEQIYWNVPDTFQLVARSTEAKPVYLPSAKILVETINRYTGAGLDIVVERDNAAPEATVDLVAAKYHFLNFFTREKFYSKYYGNKRYGILRGDWLFHLTADPAKEKGKQISINTLDPASYFPIYDPVNLDRIIGCHIVDNIIDPESGDPVISRQTYRKSEQPGGFITSELAWFALDDWEGPEAKPVKTITPEFTVQGISSLPVYHIKNFDEPGNPFGSSELRGYERVLAAINQGISDEELALALDSLGFYWTNAAPPIDPETGERTNWTIGPGRVAELQSKDGTSPKFERVQGVTSVKPMLDHIEFIEKRLKQATGATDAAVGAVDVSVEVSGVALYLQLAPLLARVAEKDEGIKETLRQLFYDLATQWFPVYDGVKFDGMTIVPFFAEKLPVDRKQVLEELKFMLENRVASAAFVRQEMARVMGYTFPEGMDGEILKERAEMAQAEDIFATRTEGELNGDGTSSESTGSPTGVGPRTQTSADVGGQTG